LLAKARIFCILQAHSRVRLQNTDALLNCGSLRRCRPQGKVNLAEIVIREVVTTSFKVQGR
jgi:hypothetical protein